jgi:hypothetical protein
VDRRATAPCWTERSSNADTSLAVALGTTVGARNEPRGVPDALTELNDKILPLYNDMSMYILH